MRMIQRKCRCKTWERHNTSNCRVEYEVNELVTSYDEWDRDFADKWQMEYDPEEWFLLPEESDFERDPRELAIERGDISSGKDHPLFMKAMSAALEDDEDEILCQLLFDGEKPLEIGRNLGMTKLAVLKKVADATRKIQRFCRNHPAWFAQIPILVPDGPYREATLPIAA